MTYLNTKDLAAKDKRLLERISAAIRGAPETFLEGGRVLDEDYSHEAFRRRRAGELRGYKTSRDMALELRAQVVAFMRERDGITPIDLLDRVPSYQHPASAERFLQELVHSGLARWEEREAADNLHPIGRRLCKLTVCAHREPLPYKPREMIVKHVLRDWQWKRTKQGDPPSLPVTQRLAIASQELVTFIGLPSREIALTTCVIAWLVSDPNAHQFQPQVCKFQSVPWLPDFEGGNMDVRCFSTLLEDVEGECKLLDAAHDSVTRLETLGIWPPPVVRSEDSMDDPKAVPSADSSAGRRSKKAAMGTAPQPLRGEALDAAAAALQVQNTDWTKTQIAAKLGVPKQRLSDPKMKALALVRERIEVERAEQRERMASMERRASLPDRDLE